MELLTLDSNFQPRHLVENYESLIWAERYAKNGDFEITSSDIAGLSKLLPRESFVTLRDSTVPMIVETHDILRPAREKPVVKITGRSAEVILDRRGSVNQLATTTARIPWYVEAATPSDAAYLAMRTVLGGPPKYQAGVEGPVLPLTLPAVSILDAIPELDLILPADYTHIMDSSTWVSTTNYSVGAKVRYAGSIWRANTANVGVMPSSSPGSPWVKITDWRAHEIKPQLLYDTVLELIASNHHGIKAVRPLDNTPQFGIEIYNGANLTGEGPTGDPANVVAINIRLDQLDSARYLLSAVGSANIAYVYGLYSGSGSAAEIVHKNSYAAPEDEPAGLARRVIPVDLTSDSQSSNSDFRKSRGLVELYDRNVTALFNGEVANQIAVGYNKDYFLGDIIKIIGDYNLTQNARVVEFVRSEDASGEKAYPTFEAVDE